MIRTRQLRAAALAALVATSPLVARAGGLPAPTREGEKSGGDWWNFFGGSSSTSTYHQAEVEALRKVARQTLSKQADLVWSSWVFGAKPDLGVPYVENERAFSDVAVRKLRDSIAGSKGAEQRALNLLTNYFAGEVISRELAGLLERKARLEADARLTVGRDRERWRDIDLALASLEKAEDREALMAAEAPLLTEMNALVRERNRVTENAVKRMGWTGIGDFLSNLRGTPLNAAEQLAVQTLDATDSLYRRLMDRRANEAIGRPLSSAHRGDLPRMLRQPRTANAFPGSRLWANGTELLKSMGVDLKQQVRLTLHETLIATKTPRPLCLAVDPPRDVRLSVKPVPGAEALREMLYESVHAAMFSLSDAEEWELRMLGGSAVTRAVGILVASIVDQPEYLRGTIRMKDTDVAPYLQAAAVRRLFAARHAAAQVLLEVGLRQDSTKAKGAELWSRHASRAYGFQMTAAEGERWVLEDSGSLAPIETLQAILLAGQLERHLQSRYGTKWWTTGDFSGKLREWLPRGSILTREELLKITGESAISPKGLVAAVESTVSL